MVKWIKTLTFINNKNVQLFIICFLYICLSLFNLKTIGVKVVNDSQRYFEYANDLQNGFYFDPHNFWYIAYPVYILFVKSIAGDIPSIVYGQHVLGLLAVIALYYTSLNLWEKRTHAFATILFFLIFINIGQWASYILAESLFTSFICFSLYLLSLTYKKSKNKLLYLATAIVVFFTAFIKPTGIAFTGSLLTVLVIQVVRQQKSKVWRASLIGFSILIFLILVNKMLTTFLIMENYQKGEIIYAITTLPPRAEYEMLVITPPEEIYIPEENLPPLIKVIAFIFHHPIYWTQLFISKLFFLLAHVRPYWSKIHNIYSLVILLPAYVLFFKGIKNEKDKMLLVFSISYLAFHLLSVSITSDDWDGRFLIPMLPMIFLFSGRGINSIKYLRTSATE
jgi:4-amino-4-deoxy-L-arabinose transferase-like glycosyltransferase